MCLVSAKMRKSFKTLNRCQLIIGRHFKVDDRAQCHCHGHEFLVIPSKWQMHVQAGHALVLLGTSLVGLRHLALSQQKRAISKMVRARRRRYTRETVKLKFTDEHRQTEGRRLAQRDCEPVYNPGEYRQLGQHSSNSASSPSALSSTSNFVAKMNQLWVSYFCHYFAALSPFRYFAR